ncbi:ubiquitin-like protein [Hypomontagnella monticulosa]|nr:ubiquitin-like protein [Hypomontagnella monticulosa]
MSDNPQSPRLSRGDSPPPRKRSRSDDRSQSPRRDRDRRHPNNYRENDSYRSRNKDRDRHGAGDSWRGRRDRNRDDDHDRSGRDLGRRGGDREERDSDVRDTDRNEGGNRDRPRPKKSLGGFKYKDKRRDELEDRDDDRRGGSFRGYRNRSPSPRRRDRDRDRDRDSKPSSSSKKSKSKASDGDTSQPPVRAPAAPAAGGGEEMIIVHVNDRLGTKAAIPCFASDRIKEFKIMVAARIGREPHEILLKRQGQRPFKDMLTLADYEISNGVQLDLEVDTGD